MKKQEAQAFIILIDEKIESLEENHEIYRKSKTKRFQLQIQNIKNDLEYWIEIRHEILHSYIK